MKLHIRIDDCNLRHTRFTAFVNGANCGTLTLCNDEFTKLLTWLRLGKRENEFVVTGYDFARRPDIVLGKGESVDAIDSSS